MFRIAIPGVIVALLFLSLGPALVYRNPMAKVDAVVLLLGNNAKRIPEAHALLKEGWGKSLVVPAKGEVSVLSDTGKISLQKKIPLDVLGKDWKGKGGFKPWWENTHIELCLARSIMEREGFSSIAIVTSPYHTRRVRFMANKVFEKSGNVIVVPTRFEEPPGLLWFLSETGFRNVASETIKNLWFLAYSVFI